MHGVFAALPLIIIHNSCMGLVEAYDKSYLIFRCVLYVYIYNPNITSICLVVSNVFSLNVQESPSYIVGPRPTMGYIQSAIYQPTTVNNITAKQAS